MMSYVKEVINPETALKDREIRCNACGFTRLMELAHLLLHLSHQVGIRRLILPFLHTLS